MTARSRPDLVLINPGNRKQAYQSLGSNLSAIEPPIWTGMLASFVRHRGFNVQIVDANAEKLSPVAAAGRAADMDPLLIAVVVYGHNPSASTQVMPAATAICTALKDIDTDVKTIMIGGHVAALPERTLRETDCDFVSDGEGFYTLDVLIRELRESRRPRYDRVPGLCRRDRGTLVRNAAAPLLQDLDAHVPGMPWDLLPMRLYRAHNWHCFDDLSCRTPYAAIYTSLGCPFNCSYCCIQAPFRTGEAALARSRNSYRLWSADWVLTQLDVLVNMYGVKSVKFADELFVMNPKHVDAICDGIIRRGYDLNIWAYARVDTVRYGMLEKLKAAGFNWLCYGIESGSARVRDDVNKGYRQDLAHSTIEATRDAGINVLGNYMFGLPEDDFESMQETLDLAIDLNCEFANFYSVMAYPGSELYEQAALDGSPLPEDWGGYGQHAANCLPLPTRHLSGPEVLNFRDDAWQTYFTNTRYLNTITETFGPLTTEHIQEMTSHKLDRQQVGAGSGAEQGTTP